MFRRSYRLVSEIRQTKRITIFFLLLNNLQSVSAGLYFQRTSTGVLVLSFLLDDKSLVNLVTPLQLIILVTSLYSYHLPLISTFLT